MSLSVRVRPRAVLDLQFAARWYEGQCPGLGTQFIDEIERLIRSLPENALLYAARFGTARRAMTRRFPYAVHFLIEPDCVVILRVLHMRRQGPEV